MNSHQFLELIWPTRGIYCLAKPFLIPGTKKITFSHRTFPTIKAAADYAESNKLRENIFFCVHSLKQASVWNPKKVNQRTQEVGAYEVRTQSNTLAAKAFFFDLDVGVEESGKLPKYPSQSEALIGLREFCAAAKLPKPLIVSSGGGLHVYWIVEQEIEIAEWKPVAQQLKDLAFHHGLKFDPSRTTDNSSVLRVAGTFNLKDIDNPRPVVAMTPAKVLQFDDFKKILSDGLIRANITPAQKQSTSPLGALPGYAAQEEGNIGPAFDGPPVRFEALARACGQIARVAVARGNVSEPEWYAALASVRLVHNGDKWAHRISNGHPQYSEDATNGKLAQLEDRGIGPTGCAKWLDLDRATCLACPLYGKVKSPMAAARREIIEAPQPIVTQLINDTEVPTIIPAAPEGFSRLIDGGGVMLKGTNKDGEDTSFQIYEHDLYPLRRLINTGTKTEDQVWCAMLPLPSTGTVVPHEFMLSADTLYDLRKFSSALANNGLYPRNSNLKHLQDYMVAYIAKLQRMTDAEPQSSHLGWTDEHDKFILPDRVLSSDGGSKPSSLSKGAQQSSKDIHKKGTLQKQVELIRFYNHPSYTPHQFFILCGLAAPLFYMTGQYGILVNASGQTGASKSTALYTAASFWGEPHLYPINGTNRGATMNGRAERVTTFANLPICVDEITNMKVPDAVDLAMSITQPGHRIRLDTNGVERPVSSSYKATIMLCTANNSLHNALSVDNSSGTAGSMRVFEIVMKPGKVHTKPEADDYLHALKSEFGHIGELFMTYIVKHRVAIEKRVRKVMREIDIFSNISAGERYWSAVVAAVLVAGEIANHLGLVTFDMKALREWCLDTQIPFMRGVVTEEYSSPITLLTTYLEQINDQILIVQKVPQNNNVTLPVKLPRGSLLARLENDTGQLYVLKPAFKQYCVKLGASERSILDDLSVPRTSSTGKEIRVCTNKNARKVLGAGTDLSKGQSHCFVIDMQHPDVSGVVDAGVVAGNPAAAVTASKGKLKLVETKQ